MKSKTLLTIILVIVLVSCTPMSISTPTGTPSPTETKTPVPPSPTITPTITPLPTETPDPNRPSDATGKDANGYYKDVQQDGNAIRYYWVELNYGNDVEKSIYKGWFASHILNGSLNSGIPLFDITSRKKMVPFYYYVQQNIQAPYIKYLGAIPEYANATSYSGFSNDFEYELMHAYTGKYFWKAQEEFDQFDKDFISGKISFSFTTPTGNYEWKLTQTSGYRFYTIKWDNADPAVYPEFYETHTGKLKYRWTIYTDKDGNLIVIEAVNWADVINAENFIAQGKVDSKYADSLFLSGILFPMQEMLALRQMPAKIKYWQGNFPFAPTGLRFSAFESKCIKATMREGPDVGKQVDLCLVPQFEIVQTP